MMRTAVILILLATAGRAEAQDIIPGSTSPDGTRALMSEPATTGTPGAPAKLWVVEMPSRRKLSANLVPTNEQAYAVRVAGGVRALYPTSLHDDQLLFLLIAGQARVDKQFGNPGVNWEVKWADDLRGVLVGGGKSKFSHAVGYRLVGRQFQRTEVVMRRTPTGLRPFFSKPPR